jgi:hypothetical protein
MNTPEIPAKLACGLGRCLVSEFPRAGRSEGFSIARSTYERRSFESEWNEEDHKTRKSSVRRIGGRGDVLDCPPKVEALFDRGRH